MACTSFRIASTALRTSGLVIWSLSIRQGESMLENHPPTKAERVCKILFRIRRDILAEQQEWAFSALSPEEQAQERARPDPVP